MKAAISPSQDFIQRKKSSVDAEDNLFKSLQGLQERHSTTHRQQRKNSMGAGRGQQQRHSNTAPHRTTGHRAIRRNSIGGSTRTKSSDGRTPRNAATPLGTQSCHGMGTKPRSLSHLDEGQTSGRKARGAHRLGRRGSTGMASDAGSRVVSPEGMNSNLIQSNVRCVTPTGSEIYNMIAVKNPRQSSGGGPKRMRQKERNGNIAESFSSCIQTNVRLSTLKPGAQPSSAERQPSDENPRRMRRRGSVGREQNIRTETQPPNRERESSGGTPRRMGRRGSTGMAAETNSAVIKTRRKSGPLSVSLHNGASRTPQSSGMEDRGSSGGAAARRMLRRGSTGMAQVVNPRVIPNGVKNICRSQSSNDAVKIPPNGEGIRSSGQRNMDWGWGTPTGPGLDGSKSSGGTKRKKSRVRRRTSTAMDQHGEMDPRENVNQTTHNPETPGSRGKGRTKSHNSRSEETAGAPVVIRSFKRSSNSESSTRSMTSATSVMSATSFDNFVWGQGDIVVPTSEQTTGSDPSSCFQSIVEQLQDPAELGL